MGTLQKGVIHVPKKTIQQEGESFFDYQQRKLREREARSTTVYFDDEAQPSIRLIERSEKHLHKDHDWHRSESIADNPIEFTEWGYCNTCFRNGDDPEFWIGSVGIVSAPWKR